MQGITITDYSGRRLLSTHFHSPLLASLAIDSAIQSNSPITWVPSLHPAAAEDDEDDEDERAERDAGWNDLRASSGGIVVCQIERRGLRYIAPVDGDMDPVVPLSFLDSVHLAFESYIGGPATEPSLKDHFDIILPLLEEMLSSSSGKPLLTSTSQLRDLVPPASSLAAKVVSTAATLAGTPASITQSHANALLSSSMPWRRNGIKYNSNEIYFDLTESLELLLSSTGAVISGSIHGSVSCRAKVSGMPDLVLSFADPSLIKPDDVAFHPCVRQGRWRKEKVVSFVPPDGTFPLLTYLFLPTSSLSFPALLPLVIKPTLTSGPIGGSFSLSVAARAPSALANIVLKLPLPEGATGFQVSAGGGRWEIEEGQELESGAGDSGLSVVWRIDDIRIGDRPKTLQGTWTWDGTPGPLSSAFSVTFESPAALFSGVRVQSVKLQPGFGGGDVGNLYKGIKTSAKGLLECRV